jgi:hypothetical protein
MRDCGSTFVVNDQGDVRFLDSVDGKLLAEAAPTPPIRGHGSPLCFRIRVSGSLRGWYSGVPNLFGFFACHPQQVGESDTLTTRNPKEPRISLY